MLRYLFIYECGFLNASDDIPEDVKQAHKDGAVDIVLMHEEGVELDGPSVLDGEGDWQPIDVIPTPPVLERKVG